MAERNDGGPAFARPAGDYEGSQHGNGAQCGMTLRDYFAAKAMQAHISRHPIEGGGTDYPFDETIAVWSYEMADAMLEARNA